MLIYPKMAKLWCKSHYYDANLVDRNTKLVYDIFFMINDLNQRISGSAIFLARYLYRATSSPPLVAEPSSSRLPRDTLIGVLQHGRVEQGQPHYAKTDEALSSRESRIVSERPFYENIHLVYLGQAHKARLRAVDLRFTWRTRSLSHPKETKKLSTVG